MRITPHPCEDRTCYYIQTNQYRGNGLPLTILLNGYHVWWEVSGIFIKQYVINRNGGRGCTKRDSNSYVWYISELKCYGHVCPYYSQKMPYSSSDGVIYRVYVVGSEFFLNWYHTEITIMLDWTLISWVQCINRTIYMSSHLRHTDCSEIEMQVKL